MEKLRVPLVKAREEDMNGDGKKNLLHFTLDMPLLDEEKVVGLQLVLIFDYKLFKFSTFQMESMAQIQYTSPAPGASFSTVGDLKLKQREPLDHRGVDERFNEQIIDSNSIYAEAYDLPKIFAGYATRNVSTIFTDSYPLWTSGRASGKPFSVSAKVWYPEENIRFRPGFWQQIKWGWVQYLSLLLVFLFVFDRIKCFIYQNQLVTTIVERPLKPKPY